MKRIGIITLNGNYNFGNKLQNYALQEYLKDKGYIVETIWNTDSKKKIIAIIKSNIKLGINAIRNKTNTIKKQIKRNKNFKNMDQLINYSKYKLSKNKIDKKINEHYDYYIVGSDQVWNYNDPSFSGVYFLDFSDDKKKNVSYAASFGVDKIEQEISFITKKLKDFNYISVREKSAKDNLNKLGISNVSVNLDPTFLLKYEDWYKKLNLKTTKSKDKYVLCYFLGSKKPLKKIEEFCKNNNYKYIDILDIKSRYYESGPKEFLEYIKGAEIVFTNSFHATVFSIIFHKKLVAFDKDSSSKNVTNSRINDLLEMLNITNRKYKETTKIDDYNKLPPINVDKKIDELRKEADEYLDNALK